jgi:hypothetical protein
VPDLPSYLAAHASGILHVEAWAARYDGRSGTDLVYYMAGAGKKTLGSCPAGLACNI